MSAAKFQDRTRTADGIPRATVEPRALSTLWLNTGTLCNLTCANCYIESSPTNDRLVYLSAHEAAACFDELATLVDEPIEIGFTGGEPFMNPDFLSMLEDALARGHRALVLTNAMRPMMKHVEALRRLRTRFHDRLNLRVSVDHYSEAGHRAERGPKSWGPTLAGLRWLVAEGFAVAVAGRTYWDESEAALRRGYAALFARLSLPIDADDPAELVLFPEMDATADVPEISVDCWDLLGVSPADMMCATSRMVIKRRGHEHPEVVSCTLLPYEPEFVMGRSLRESLVPVPLNHPHCARFCVLGGGSCTA